MANEERSQNDSHPEIGISVSHSSQESDPGGKSDMVIRVQQGNPSAPLGFLRKNKRRRAPQDSRVKTPLRQLN